MHSGRLSPLCGCGRKAGLTVIPSAASRQIPRAEPLGNHGSEEWTIIPISVGITSIRQLSRDGFEIQATVPPATERVGSRIGLRLAFNNVPVVIGPTKLPRYHHPRND